LVLLGNAGISIVNGSKRNRKKEGLQPPIHRTTVEKRRGKKSSGGIEKRKGVSDAKKRRGINKGGTPRGVNITDFEPEWSQTSAKKGLERGGKKFGGGMCSGLH